MNVPRKGDRLRGLTRLAGLVSSSLDADEILGQIAAAAAELVDAKIASLWVADEAAQTLELRACSDEAIGASHPARGLRFGEGGAGWVALHRRPLDVPDLFADDRLRARAWFAAQGLRSAYAVPIIHGVSLVGVLALLGERPFVFDTEAHDLLDAFVAHAAVAIHNARLFAKSEARRQDAEALADVGRLLAQTLDPIATARCVVENVCRLLGARSSALYRCEPESGGLRLETVWGDVALTFHWAGFLPPGTGLAALAVRDRRPLTSPDILSDPRITYTSETRRDIEAASDRSRAVVPLCVQQRVFGVLVIGDVTGRVFTGAEIQLTQAFADQAAVALENARLFEDSERRRREAAVLAEIVGQINGSLDIATILERIVDGARELTGADGARIALREPGTEAFRMQYQRGLGEGAFVGALVTPGKGAGGLVLATGQPFRTANYLEDPRITGDHADRVRTVGIVAEMVVPVRNGEVKGLLYVFNRSARPFTDRDEAALCRLADHAAIALGNANLLAEAERRRREAESLAEVGRLISRSLEPAEVGQRITDSVCRLLDAPIATLYRLTPDTMDLIKLASGGPADGPLPHLPKGAGATGLAVQEREAVVSADVLTDPRIRFTAEQLAAVAASDYHAILALPLVVNERVIGALTVGDRVGRVFGADEVRLAQTFVDQAVIALENARLHAETTRRKWEAEVLADVGRLFAESLDADTIAHRIADTLRALLGSYSSVLTQLDPESGDLVGRWTAGDGPARGVVFPRGTGMMGLAVRTRDAVTTTNLLTDPRAAFTPELRAQLEALPHRAVLAVPLLVQDRVIGALAIGDLEGRVFDAEEIRLAKSFADRAAVALENSQLFQDAEGRRREAEVFAELTGQITASLDLDTILSRVGEAARDLCTADLGWVALRDVGTGLMRLRHWPGARAPHTPTVVEPGKGIGGQVLLTGRPFRTDDYRSDPRITQAYESIVAAEDVVTALVVPIQIEERIEGLLYVENRTPRPFTDRDEAQLARLAAQAAIAIRNARLIEALRVHQGRLEALLDVSHELTRIQPVESLLDAIAKACGQVLDSPSVGFRLVEGDELVVSGVWGDATEVMLAARIKIGESGSGIVAATGAPLTLTNVDEDPRIVPAHRDALRRLGYHAWLGVPAKVGERVVGVLSIRTRRPQGFTKADEAIATAFASQAASALENARLFQQVQAASEEVSRAQAELLHSQKMDAIGRLAGGVAHDFNNLLTIVHGRSEILLRRLQLDDKSRQDLELIQRTARRAATLTQQLLAFSRKQVLQPKLLGLNAVVAELATMLRRLIGEDIDLAIVPGAGLDRVKADPGQLEQVLMNLAVNARDTMPQGGRLVIETATVELGEAFVRERPGARPGPHVRLSVTDEGAGMTPEVQARMFEPFFTTKETGRGTGLGLSTVYGIVKQHNGYIDVRSAPGEGTAFEIYLPRVDTEAIVETEEETAGAPRGSETILLVEDEDEVRELAREILEMAGYTVLEAPHGPDALRVCRHHQGPIHLLLSDVVMPQMSGRELARQLAALRPDTKVAYMSGYTDDALGHHGVLDPDVVLLPKPFTPDSLLAGVRRALDPPGPVS